MDTILRLIQDESAQTTAEYALVILGAAAIAGILISWAGSSGIIKKLFDGIFNKLMTAFK